MTRFTHREMEAIETALNQCLAGPLDGYDEGTPEALDKERAMRAALAKMQARLGEAR